MQFQTSWLQQATLYRYRYVLGYSLLFVLLTYVLVVDVGILPAGINTSEMSTAIVSSQVGSLTNFEWIVNAPYHALQFALMWLFGLTKFALVLPSLIFSGATILLFILTMKQWFKPNVAIVTSIVAITTPTFINMARTGTPEIMLSFWTILLLFASVKLLMQQEKGYIWKVLVAFSAAALLYTPFGIYPLAAFVVSGLLHPHIRSKLRKTKRQRFVVLGFITLIILLPLAYTAWTQPKIIDMLTGLSAFIYAFEQPMDNLRTLFNYYANFLYGRLEGGRILPTFGVITLVLAALGLFQAIKDRHTARSYALLTWTAVTAIIILLVPREQGVILMPVMLLLAIGIQTLIYDWYKLFPRNPYARIAGLIPLSILFIGVGYSNIMHYFATMRYNTNETYSYSLPDVQKTLAKDSDKPAYLIVRPSELEFYKLIQYSFPRTSILTEPHDPEVRHPTLILPGATNTYTQPPTHIDTTYTTENEVTLRTYRP